MNAVKPPLTSYRIKGLIKSPYNYNTNGLQFTYKECMKLERKARINHYRGL